jgi:hypothetical protein
MSVFGIERSVEIPDKMYSEEIQRMSRRMLPPRQAMQWRVVFRSRKKTNVGSSIVKSVDRFCRRSFHSNAVVNRAPAVTIWFVDRKGKLAGMIFWRQTQQRMKKSQV